MLPQEIGARLRAEDDAHARRGRHERERVGAALSNAAGAANPVDTADLFPE